MINILIGVFIFCLVLFFYLHIQFHLKTSDDLEIYEIEQASKTKMEEICDLRQPVLFDCDEEGDKIIQTTNKDFLLDNYHIFEVKIRDCLEPDSASELYVPLPLRVANKLFSDDKQGSYFSENNGDFLVETGAVKNMMYNDEFLRPNLVSNCNYDVMFGSANVETPFRYEINYRNYFMVTQGSIKIKLAPPKSSRYLYPVSDYESFEFRTPINPWSPQTKFRADFDKIKCLEIVLTPGKYLFIPAYWWYSFKFSENTSVSCFRYRTYMNNIAISPNICMYALQNQNVERKIAKKIDIVHLQQQNTNNSKSDSIKVNTNTNANGFIDVISDNTSGTNIHDINETTDIQDINETTDINEIPPILLDSTMFQPSTSSTSSFASAL